MNKETFQEIITKLIALGEDKEELEFWLSIFDDLSEERQTEIFLNMQEELEALARD